VNHEPRALEVRVGSAGPVGVDSLIPLTRVVPPLFLLIAQVIADQLCVCGRERGHGLAEHPHEMVDLFGGHGVSDVLATGFAGNGPIRVRNQFAAFVEEGEKGQAGAFGAQLGFERLATGRVEDGLVGVFLHVDAGDHEMPGEDGLDCGSLDKPIEALAPPSPGGAENQKDVLVLRGGLRFGALEHLLGGGRACCCQRLNSNE